MPRRASSQPGPRLDAARVSLSATSFGAEPCRRNHGTHGVTSPPLSSMPDSSGARRHRRLCARPLPSAALPHRSFRPSARDVSDFGGSSLQIIEPPEQARLRGCPGSPTTTQSAVRAASMTFNETHHHQQPAQYLYDAAARHEQFRLPSGLRSDQKNLVGSRGRGSGSRTRRRSAGRFTIPTTTSVYLARNNVERIVADQFAFLTEHLDPSDGPR